MRARPPHQSRYGEQCGENDGGQYLGIIAKQIPHRLDAREQRKKANEACDGLPDQAFALAGTVTVFGGV
ncbi:hypothetical protein [Corynebacterium sp.]|uniref:hypothetical protein n=1 Tax=Corynebacterium sp. TaxID=1720 RepID=UPI0027BA6B70|nr:hypothetical protein [Corynebacterium sp.]